MEDVDQQRTQIVIVGCEGVGKTSLLCACAGKDVKAARNESKTSCVDFRQTRFVGADGDIYVIKLWDSCGQERFHSYTRSYFRNSDGIIIVIDLTNRQSFEEINELFR